MVKAKAKTTPRRSIRCYFCGHRHNVSSRTMTSSCPKCNKAIKVEDIVVKSYLGVINLQTCGKIMITKRGRLNARLVQAVEGIFCEGVVQGSIETNGPASMGPKAQWKGGHLRCPRLYIQEGAQLTGDVTVPCEEAIQFSINRQ